MIAIRTKAFRTGYFYLTTAGLPMLASTLAINDVHLSAIAYAAAIALAFPVSLLPGHIGSKRYVPLRLTVAVLLAAAMAAAGTLFALHDGQFFLRGTFWGMLCGVLFFFAVREACAELPMWTGIHGCVIGIVGYIAPGVILTFLDMPALKTWIWALSLAFLGVTAFAMNHQNMLTGLSTRTNARPPLRLVHGNRALTIIFALIAIVVVFFGQLRELCTRAANWVIWAVLYVLAWIASLSGGGDSTGAGGEGGDQSSMLAGLGQGEASPFWLAAEKVMVVLAVIIGIALALYALYYIGKLLVRLARHIAAYLRRFAEEAGADYVDETEDLFDFDDLKQNVQERFSRAIRRFTERPKKWDDMTVRERVRFCVKALYKRAGDSIPGVTSLTVREAAPRLVREGMDAQAVAELYERARYSEDEIAPDEAESLKKAVRP